MRLILSAGLLLALILPVLSLTFSSETYEVNFDDLISSPNEFERTEVKTYAALQWHGFTVDTPREKHKGEFKGVQAKTAPNFACGRVDSFGGPPTITVTYPSSEVSLFDLERFWWGCTTKDESSGKAAGWCTLDALGYAPGSKDPTAKAASFFFPKKDAKSMEMVETILPPTFKAVSKVEFRVTAMEPTLFLDNVKYTVYNVTSIGKGLNEVIHSQETTHSTYGLLRSQKPFGLPQKATL